jgi:hypothetical protein
MIFVSWRRASYLLLASTLACGPKAGLDPTDTGDGSSTDGSGTTTGTTSTTGVTTGIETTSTVTGNPTTANPTTTNPTLTTDGEDSGVTSNSFIFPSDGGGGGCGNAVRLSPCDPWNQDCTRGEKCSPASGGCDELETPICDDLARQPVPLGDACTSKGYPLSGFNDCDIGATCWFVDPESLTGTCVSLCHGSREAPDCSHVPGTACVFVHDNDDAPLCLPTCDPFEPTCSGGHHCHPTPHAPEVFACIPDTAAPIGAAFDACDHTNCAPGLLCAEPEAAAVECAPDTNCCTPLCDLDAPACPGAGQTCLPYYEIGQAPAGLENVGRCGLP